MKKIRSWFRLFVRRIFGHKYDCCSRITERCKKCPFSREEMQKLTKKYDVKAMNGYFDSGIRKVNRK